MLSLIALSIAVVAAQSQLELGYPTGIDLTKGQSCVLDMKASEGASVLRVVVDVSDFGTFVTGTNIKVYAGRYRNGGPKLSAGGSLTKEQNGDVILSLDRPTLAGVPEKWWLVITHDGDYTLKASVTATSYDFAENPRTSIKFGKRTGMIPLELGASEIFYGSLKSSELPATVHANINAAKWGSVLDQYDVYVNILNDAKINEIKSTLTLGDLITFIRNLSQAFKTGNFAKALPGLLTPTAAKHDIKAAENGVLGINLLKKFKFDLPGGEGNTIFYAALVPRQRLVGKQVSAFSVAWTTNDQKAVETPAPGTCGALSKKRAVEQEDACRDKTCKDCTTDTNCHYCRDAADGESACRAVATPCTDATAKVPDEGTCSVCLSATDETSCKAASADCMYCTGLSADSIVTGCVDKWRCQEAQAQASSTTGAAGGTTGAPGATTTGAASTEDGSSSSVVVLTLSAVLVALIALV